MPHLRFRSINQDIVKLASVQLPKPLAKIIMTDEENFTFEKIETQFFQMGQVVESFPFIEFCWFQRSQEIQNNVVMCITDFITKELGAVDVVVVFIALTKSAYYENGQHF